MNAPGGSIGTINPNFNNNGDSVREVSAKAKESSNGGDGGLKIRLTNNSGLIKDADWGFSWKTLIFGAFVPLLRGDLAWFFIGIFLAVCTFGFAWLVFPFTYNKIYVKKLLAQGFYPLDEESRKTLVNAGIILDKGPIVRPMETTTDGIPDTPQVKGPSGESSGWICPFCEKKNSRENNFCFSCGQARVQARPVCPKCGREYEGDMNFCPSCGTPLHTHEKAGGSGEATAEMPEHHEPPPVRGETGPVVVNPSSSHSEKIIIGLLAVVGIAALVLFFMKGEAIKSFFGSETGEITTEGRAEIPSTEAIAQEKRIVGQTMKPLITSSQAGESNLGFRIALYCSEQKATMKDLALELGQIMEGARNGDPEAMDMLGYIYENGRCIEKRSAAAAVWYEKAANAGLPEAMNDIGYMYLNGIGVPRNDVAAANWFRKAAGLGNPEAMNNLGYMFTRGRGVKKNQAQAAIWYQRAANLGQPHGMKNLGHAYMYGLGLPQDQQLGKKWLLEAAEAGEPNAMYSIARMYEHGVGGVQDYGESARWYKKASLLGHDGALRGLANLYKKGLGVGRDFSEAEKLVEIADQIKRKSY
jgi:TPR repeat protein